MLRKRQALEQEILDSEQQELDSRTETSGMYEKLLITIARERWESCKAPAEEALQQAWKILKEDAEQRQKEREKKVGKHVWFQT